MILRTNFSLLQSYPQLHCLPELILVDLQEKILFVHMLHTFPCILFCWESKFIFVLPFILEKSLFLRLHLYISFSMLQFNRFARAQCFILHYISAYTNVLSIRVKCSNSNHYIFLGRIGKRYVYV